MPTSESCFMAMIPLRFAHPEFYRSRRVNQRVLGTDGVQIRIRIPYRSPIELETTSPMLMKRRGVEQRLVIPSASNDRKRSNRFREGAGGGAGECLRVVMQISENVSRMRHRQKKLLQALISTADGQTLSHWIKVNEEAISRDHH
jgi:hypothetical protein